MAFGKKFDKNKLKLKQKRQQQNPLFKRKKFCRFTAANVEQVDYKDVDTLKDFVQENGKIMPARLTGTKAHYQRQVDTALKRAEFEAQRAELEKAAAAKLGEAQAQGEKLTGLTVQISQKSGVDGRLFGSVTNFDIAEALSKQGFPVEKAQIRLPLGPLKTVGDHPISVALHTDVVVEVTISVLGEHA